MSMVPNGLRNRQTWRHGSCWLRMITEKADLWTLSAMSNSLIYVVWLPAFKKKKKTSSCLPLSSLGRSSCRSSLVLVGPRLFSCVFFFSRFVFSFFRFVFFRFFVFFFPSSYCCTNFCLLFSPYFSGHFRTRPREQRRSFRYIAALLLLLCCCAAAAAAACCCVYQVYCTVLVLLLAVYTYSMIV